MKRYRELAPGQILWSRPAEGKGAAEEASTLAWLKAGELAVRKTDEPESEVLFHYVPEMIVGDTAVMNLIDGRKRQRTACVYAREQGALVQEYEPEKVRAHVQRGEEALPLALLRTLIAHIVVNYWRIRFKNKRNRLAMRVSDGGLLAVDGQARAVTPARIRRCTWDEYKALFSQLYHPREASRELYYLLTKYKGDDGIEEATREFRKLFGGRPFPQRIAEFLEGEGVVFVSYEKFLRHQKRKRAKR